MKQQIGFFYLSSPLLNYGNRFKRDAFFRFIGLYRNETTGNVHLSKSCRYEFYWFCTQPDDGSLPLSPWSNFTVQGNPGKVLSGTMYVSWVVEYASYIPLIQCSTFVSRATPILYYTFGTSDFWSSSMYSKLK